VQTHHKFRKIQSFLHQKVRTSASEEPPLVRKMSTLENPTNCGRLMGQSLTATFGSEELR